jgi:hypothetical protein
MDPTKPLQEWTDVELKAAAYDELLRLDATKKNIRLIQEELVRRNGQNRIQGSASRQES